MKYVQYIRYIHNMHASDDTCYIPESRLKTFRITRTETERWHRARIQHNSAKIKFWFSPCWLCQRGKTPLLHLGLALRFACALHTGGRRSIDISCSFLVDFSVILAHFWWILVEPPSPQEFAPLHNQAVGRVPRPLKIHASHDMYLCFGPQFPDGQTLYRYASDFEFHFLCKNAGE